MNPAFERFVAAVKDGRVDDVRALLAAEPEVTRRIDDPHPQLPFDSTPLLAAVSQANVELIDVLLGAGADINAKSRWWAGGFGVLHTCAPELAPFLIERGAAVDIHAAARLGLTDDLDRLLYADPDLVRARGGDGQTALHFASTVQVARRLLDRGADIDALDIDHESTPAQWMLGDRPDVARYLISRGCRTDILMTAALGELELTRLHLDNDPSSVRIRVSERYFPKNDPRAGGTIYNWTLGGNKTAHSAAFERGHEQVYQLLMKRSPAAVQLVAACEVGEEAAVRRLLENEPNLIAALDTDDRARLAFAAQNNDARTVSLMLRAGWPLDGRGDTGGTALHWASWHGNTEIVQEILRYGPDVEARDGSYGITPLAWALHGSLNSWHRRTGDYGATVGALLDAGAHAPADADAVEASEAARDVLRRRGSR